MTDVEHWILLAGRLAARTRDHLAALGGWVLDGDNRFYWLYLLSFVVVGIWIWRLPGCAPRDSFKSLRLLKWT